MYRIMGANRKEYGPVSAEQLKNWVLEGRATAKTQVSVDGGPWAPLGELSEFAADLAARRPPPAPRPEPARAEQEPRAEQRPRAERPPQAERAPRAELAPRGDQGPRRRDELPRSAPRPRQELANPAPRQPRPQAAKGSLAVRPPSQERGRPEPRRRPEPARSAAALEAQPRAFHNYATLKPAVEHPLVKKAMLASLLGLLPLPIIGSTVGVLLSLKALSEINGAPHDYTTPASKARLALMVALTGYAVFLTLYASGIYGRVFGLLGGG